jgi:hypothetical protein
MDVKCHIYNESWNRGIISTKRGIITRINPVHSVPKGNRGTLYCEKENGILFLKKQKTPIFDP